MTSKHHLMKDYPKFLTLIKKFLSNKYKSRNTDWNRAVSSIKDWQVIMVFLCPIK